MMFRHECPVRFDDLDSYGHVNNVTFAEYLQEARVAFAAEVLGTAVHDVGYVVARQAIDYHAPVGFRATPLIVNMWVSQLGSSSFTAAYRVCDDVSDPTVYVSAESVLVAVDPQTQRPRKLTDRERKAITPYQAEAA